jgi:hypothetical protein
MNAQTPVVADGLALLRQPFPAHQISKLPKETKAQSDARKNREQGCMVWKCPECGGPHHKDAVHLDYVGHAALTDRLLDADPHWSWEPMGYDERGLPALGPGNGLWIKLTVCGQTRPGFGSADGKTGGDAIKEMIGDALRNAAMRFGAALDLWHKGDLHLEEDSGRDTAGEREISPPGADTAPEPVKWTEPGSIYSGIHKLKQGLRQHDRDLDGCGDSEMVYALCNTDEWREFCRVAELHAPWYLRGGEPAPPEFEGLLVKAERLVKGFDSATAAGKVDLIGV